jgi:hypothetical protein
LKKNDKFPMRTNFKINVYLLKNFKIYLKI